MKATISLDNAVLEQLLAYTQAKTAKESIPKRLKNISALSNARSCSVAEAR